ncbi:DNA polymerase alpha/epsilon subunit B-domain-containing protein [Lipomyces arxii]|uniref:DNA polymerase alpha/epsilon subunit B-domain-containing protein n=1 Tax=Lipomyces arxii TaxID=56418 RepID=UPI0034CD9E21
MMPVASSSTLHSELLTAPSLSSDYIVPSRTDDKCGSDVKYNADYVLKNKEKTYTQQYAGLYFLRLAVLKPRAVKAASEAWDGMAILNQEVKRVDRVLDVKQGEFCWAVGTVYMEMLLKPNILDEITKEFWTTVPISSDKIADSEHDSIMLEDESGRLNLTGAALKQELLVTGCVIAVLGSETTDGDFDVIDVRYPDLAPQIARPITQEPTSRQGKYIALISGLEISGDVYESYETTMLMEYLMGELGGSKDAIAAANIMHVILAGNTFGDSETKSEDRTKAKKKYGYDSGAYNVTPTATVDSMLADLCASVAVDLMPGDSDPTNLSLPQQAITPALVPRAREFSKSTFKSVTNPHWWDCDGVRILGTAGQPIDDIFKYVDGDDRLRMMEYTLRWQHCAPTAPDTLWSYPFQDHDPFVLSECPHVYFAGNQPSFSTKTIEGRDGQCVCLITVPKFASTGEIVLLDVDSLQCKVVKFKK